MKKILVLLSLILSLLLSASAQITISRSDYGVVGDKVWYAVDTPAAALNAVANITGSAKTWNFTSGVVVNSYDSVMYIPPSFAPNPPAGANLLVVSANNSQFENVDSNFVKLILDRPQYNINGLSLKVFKFPFTYGSVLIDSVIYSKAGIPADFNFTPAQAYGADSLRFDIHGYAITTGTGYGTITLPDTSCTALQVATTGISYTLISVHGSPLGAGWVVANQFLGIPVYQKTINVEWIAKNSKSFIAQAAMDTNGTIVQSFTYRVKKTVIPKITSVTPINGQRGQMLNVTISGTNTHFTQASSSDVLFSQGSSTLILNSINSLNDSTLSASITITQTDPLGYYDVKVSDAADGILSLNASFQVLPATVLPSLTKVAPGYASPGQTLNVTITGANTHFTQGSSAVNFLYQGSPTSNIIVNSMTALSDTTLDCNITLNTAIADGTYDIQTLNTVDATLNLTGAFSVVSTGINETENAFASVFIYPNPANDVLNISFASHPSSSVNIQLFDITGRNVKCINTSNNDLEIDVSNLNNGIYFCKITAKDFTTSRKIIINK